MKDYNFVVNATYAKEIICLNQAILKNRLTINLKKSSEVGLEASCQFKHLRIVINGGPFTCIDPFDETGHHLMGNVEVAILSRNTGKFPKIPGEIMPLLNKGVISNPPVTRFNDFISAAKEFFVGIEEAKHVGSMFTVRTVYPHHEHDDARPTDITEIGDKIISLFSGKIPTCVSAADKVVNLINQKGNK